MSGWFPNSGDGGLPPNPNDLLNPAKAYPPLITPTNTSALYYGNGCDVRLRPEVVNSIISELEASVDEAKLPYDHSKQDNLEHAIRYLIQRGLAVGALAHGGTNDYTLFLDPKMYPGYNNFMTLCVVPEKTNAGPVRLNVDGYGWTSLLRNDSRELQADDFRVGIPLLINYQNGYWYLLGMARSQVPIIPMEADVDGWIRTDGNDITGDGTANTPEKAFKTINGAWDRLGRKYLPSMIYTIHLRLGIPGTYPAAHLGPYGGRIALHGNTTGTGQDYRIDMSPTGWYCLALNGINFFMEGVNLLLTLGAGYEPWCLNAYGSEVWMKNVIVTCSNSPGNRGGFFLCSRSSVVTQGILDMRGNGAVIDRAIAVGGGAGAFNGAAPVSGNLMYASNMTFTTAFVVAQAQSFVGLSVAGIGPTNTYGPKYLIFDYAIGYGWGNIIPGSTAGTTGSGGLWYP